jgi:hypothetical protein
MMATMATTARNPKARTLMVPGDIGAAKEVQITPLTIHFGTENPPKYKMGYLTPITMQYRSVDPLRTTRAVLLGGIADVDGCITRKMHIARVFMPATGAGPSRTDMIC